MWSHIYDPFGIPYICALLCRILHTLLTSLLPPFWYHGSVYFSRIEFDGSGKVIHPRFTIFPVGILFLVSC